MKKIICATLCLALTSTTVFVSHPVNASPSAGSDGVWDHEKGISSPSSSSASQETTDDAGAEAQSPSLVILTGALLASAWLTVLTYCHKVKGPSRQGRSTLQAPDTNRQRNKSTHTQDKKGRRQHPSSSTPHSFYSSSSAASLVPVRRNPDAFLATAVDSRTLAQKQLDAILADMRNAVKEGETKQHRGNTGAAAQVVTAVGDEIPNVWVVPGSYRTGGPAENTTYPIQVGEQAIGNTTAQPRILPASRRAGIEVEDSVISTYHQVVRELDETRSK